MQTNSRFDYVRYDEQSMAAQALIKALVVQLEGTIRKNIISSRPTALALTKLEECYMWAGKAIRDDQIARGGDATDQPRRGELEPPMDSVPCDSCNEIILDGETREVSLAESGDTVTKCTSCAGAVPAGAV